MQNIRLWNPVAAIAYVVPMPLQPGLLNLYLVARVEGFEEEAIERRDRTIKPLDLKFGDFAQYDWVIYLPPKDAIDRAIKDLYTTEDREMTLEFIADGDGSFSKMELRRKRWRETISRK